MKEIITQEGKELFKDFDESILDELFEQLENVSKKEE